MGDADPPGGSVNFKAKKLVMTCRINNSMTMIVGTINGFTHAHECNCKNSVWRVLILVSGCNQTNRVIHHVNGSAFEKAVDPKHKSYLPGIFRHVTMSFIAD